MSSDRVRGERGDDLHLQRGVGRRGPGLPADGVGVASPSGGTAGRVAGCRTRACRSRDGDGGRPEPVTVTGSWLALPTLWSDTWVAGSVTETGPAYVKVTSGWKRSAWCRCRPVPTARWQAPAGPARRRRYQRQHDERLRHMSCYIGGELVALVTISGEQRASAQGVLTTRPQAWPTVFGALGHDRARGCRVQDPQVVRPAVALPVGRPVVVPIGRRAVPQTRPRAGHQHVGLQRQPLSRLQPGHDCRRRSSGDLVGHLGDQRRAGQRRVVAAAAADLGGGIPVGRRGGLLPRGRCPSRTCAQRRSRSRPPSISTWSLQLLSGYANSPSPRFVPVRAQVVQRPAGLGQLLLGGHGGPVLCVGARVRHERPAVAVALGAFARSARDCTSASACRGCRRGWYSR